MPALAVRLFGPGVLQLQGTVLRVHSARTLGLLAFLALDPGRAHGRERIAGLLWGEMNDALARQSLRQALYSLRTIGGGALREALRVSSDSVTFEPPADADIDVLRFLDGVRSADPARWAEAGQLSGAPLLDGSTLDDHETFGPWLVATRERLLGLAVRNLDRLVLDRLLQGDPDEALRHAERLCGLVAEGQAWARQLPAVFATGRPPATIVDAWARLRGTLGYDSTLESPHPAMTAHATDRRDPTFAACRAEPDIVRGTPAAAARRGGQDVLDPDSLIRAAQAAARVDALGLAVDLYDRALLALERAGPDRSSRLLDVLLLKEAMLERLGRRIEQAATIERALALAQHLGDEPRLASAWIREAGVCAYLGDFDAGQHAAEQALELLRRFDDRPGQAEALRELGFVLWRRADHAAALACTRQALELHRLVGDTAGEASALHNLAEIHRDLGSPRQALEWFEMAMPLHWAARSHEGEILTLFGIASALQQLGDTTQAASRYQQALELSERHGLRTMQSRALHALAKHHAGRQDLDLAMQLMRRAIEIDRSIGYAHGLGHDLVALAQFHLERAELTEARAVLREALVWFGFTDDRDALESTQAWIDDLEAGRRPIIPLPEVDARVKSHLSLGEGKVYCAFESPLARRGPDGSGPTAPQGT